MSRLIFTLIMTLFFGVLIFPKRLIPFLDEMPFLSLIYLFTFAEWLRYILLFVFCYFLSGDTAMDLLERLEKKFRGN